ncbi:hypothetical protein EVAR_96029_1 [Eumeta japonica]|uniref:Craniofacial development protein 2 n=1 Tax=Eumeta variegata TaxID=151549 RepID=A0A4C1XH52_EUMVA|nr:hypothetical protein EVAR_96029_1 [Eumeta japonica]
MDDKIDDVSELMKDRPLDILCVIEAKGKGSGGTIKSGSLGIYAPNMSKPIEEREEFWADVRDILVKCGRNERIVIFGDISGWVGIQRDGYEKVLVADDNVTATEYMIDDGNESEMTIDEIVEALERMKVEKAAGYDRVSSEILGGGGGIVASLLY